MPFSAMYRLRWYRTAFLREGLQLQYTASRGFVSDSWAFLLYRF